MLQDEIRFDDRAILVTGAGRGLGRSYALLLASRGAKVVVADNGAAMDGEVDTPGLATAVVGEIRDAGGVATACHADLSSEAGSKAAVDAAVEAYGRIDGLLHNASTVPELATTDVLSSHDLEVVLRINTFAGLWMARAAWPHMVRQAFGRIVYTTSVGIYGQQGTAPYCAAKAASIGIVRSLADEGKKHGILVNGIAPSARTRMTEHFLDSEYGRWLFRTMPPEKVAVAATYLMSEDCDLTGEILTLGGGRIGRLLLGETEGIVRSGQTIEEVRDALPLVMTEDNVFYPKSVAERSARIARLLGFVDSAGS